MKTSISSIALAVIGIGSLAFAIPMSVARAQAAPSASDQQAGQAGPPPVRPGQNNFGNPGQQGQFGQGGFNATPQPMQFRGGGMGGGATMVADTNSLFILMGNRLFRVNKENLQVIKEGMLPVGQPGMDMAPGGGAAGPRRGGGQGGGDQAK